MGLWGLTTADEDKPKFLPVDSNAAGSSGARENIIASKSGWALAPGLAASGNDNTDAEPEILVCVKNIAEAMGNASIIGIDWTDATVAVTGLVDITVTFDEAVDITSAAWSANQTITNKAYILLSRIGKTDMVEDSTIAAMYFSGSGTNQLVFRGTAQTNAATAFIGFNGAGVGDDAFSTGIIFDGTSAMDEEDGNSALGLRQEAGTAASPSFGDKIVLDGTDGAGANAGDEIIADGISFTVAGPSFATRSDITTVARTGQELGGNILLEIGVEGTDDGEDHIILDGTDGSSTNAGSTLDLEDFTSGVATYLQAGSTSGTAYVLAGIDIAAA
jgi:hypothetical protein|tara:strand:+ start:263 stop:1258 length:996 start_codon:yes stop_codon:yes gene_type:complete